MMFTSQHKNNKMKLFEIVRQLINIVVFNEQKLVQSLNGKVKKLEFQEMF